MNIKEFRTKNGFCPDCGMNLRNQIVESQHKHGKCKEKK